MAHHNGTTTVRVIFEMPCGDPACLDVCSLRVDDDPRLTEVLRDDVAGRLEAEMTFDIEVDPDATNEKYRVIHE